MWEVDRVSGGIPGRGNYRNKFIHGECVGLVLGEASLENGDRAWDGEKDTEDGKK
jgi:hypothetical protein